jgi:hypothetical protein
MAEEFGVQGRGAFYDKTGAIRHGLDQSGHGAAGQTRQRTGQILLGGVQLGVLREHLADAALAVAKLSARARSVTSISVPMSSTTPLGFATACATEWRYLSVPSETVVRYSSSQSRRSRSARSKVARTRSRSGRTLAGSTSTATHTAAGTPGRRRALARVPRPSRCTVRRRGRLIGRDAAPGGYGIRLLKPAHRSQPAVGECTTRPARITNQRT